MHETTKLPFGKLIFKRIVTRSYKSLRVSISFSLTSCSSAFLLPLRVRVRSALPPSCFLFAFLLLFRFVLFFVLLLPLPLSVSCSPSYCLFDFLCVVRLASSSSRLLSSFALLVLLVRVGSFSSVRASFCGIGNFVIQAFLLALCSLAFDLEHFGLQ